MNILSRLKNLFRKRSIVEETKASVETTPTINVSKTPGLKCPECGNLIVISIQQLTTYQPLSCGFCGLQLEIDQEKSAPSIAALSKLERGLEDAAKQKRDAFS